MDLGIWERLGRLWPAQNQCIQNQGPGSALGVVASPPLFRAAPAAAWRIFRKFVSGILKNRSGLRGGGFNKKKPYDPTSGIYNGGSRGSLRGETFGGARGGFNKMMALRIGSEG